MHGTTRFWRFSCRTKSFETKLKAKQVVHLDRARKWNDMLSYTQPYKRHQRYSFFGKATEAVVLNVSKDLSKNSSRLWILPTSCQRLHFRNVSRTALCAVFGARRSKTCFKRPCGDVAETWPTDRDYFWPPQVQSRKRYWIACTVNLKTKQSSASAKMFINEN